MQQWLYIQSELCILKSGWICHIKYSTWEVQSGFLFSAFPWQKATTLSACKHDPLSKIISGVTGLKSGTFGWFLFPKFPRRVMAKSIPWDDSAWGSWGKYHPWPYSTFVPIYSSALIPSFLPKLSITKLEIQTSTKSFLAVNFLADFFFPSLHTEYMRAIKSTHSLTHRKLMCWWVDPHQGSTIEADFRRLKPFSRPTVGWAVWESCARCGGMTKQHLQPGIFPRERQMQIPFHHGSKSETQVSPVHTRCPCHQASSCSLATACDIFFGFWRCRISWTLMNFHERFQFQWISFS